ncbi:hypothetical protein [Streptomyces sp. GQFP]|uniref:hypothetical protein n=1 Tax=Streptomyces sp. GQFP TaxID=2907545 RepID=UPI001F2CF93C|nr:hypothetical protein [Streptomyces sp. GQFP]UIX34083.1 hypothetical protein LUX31_31050 [Streptomyces sp. GQFP]
MSGSAFVMSRGLQAAAKGMWAKVKKRGIAPRAQGAVMWSLAIAINTTGVVLGYLWGPEALLQLLVPGVGSIIAAGLVSYSIRK